MHLKSLTLKGFKSFASATTLRLEPGITCVVGPNGSGKSNVVDAISWVLGEQGAKALRGGKMEDVIFAGTSGRAPLGRAEVTLTVDNSDGALPIDYSEVSITRRMFRDGAGEYEINGTACRLLDIQELLSDSGIGRELHVVVGQGQLDSVLQSRPEDRRAYIEEAAGVLKHRKRKEKALRKLDAMQANLTRLTDLTGELRRQLKPLGRQAEIARRAQAVQSELRDARLRLAADDLVTLRGELAREEADEAVARARRLEVEEQLAVARAEQQRLEDALAQDAPRLSAAQDTWYRLSTLAERLRGTVGLAQERARHLADTGDTRAPGRDPDELEAEAEIVAEQEAELVEGVVEARQQLAEVLEERAEHEATLAAAERAHLAAVRALADRRAGLATLAGRAAALRSGVSANADEIERLSEALAEADARTQEAVEQLEAAREETGVDAEADDGLGERVAEASQAHEAARARVRELVAAERAAEQQRAHWRARVEALSVGLARRDGSGTLLGDGAPGGVLGAVSRLITVEPDARTAVAAALGELADAVAVDSPEAAVGALRQLRSVDAGRATLLVGARRPGCRRGGPATGRHVGRRPRARARRAGRVGAPGPVGRRGRRRPGGCPHGRGRRVHGCDQGGRPARPRTCLRRIGHRGERAGRAGRGGRGGGRPRRRRGGAGRAPSRAGGGAGRGNGPPGWPDRRQGGTDGRGAPGERRRGPARPAGTDRTVGPGRGRAAAGAARRRRGQAVRRAAGAGGRRATARRGRGRAGRRRAGHRGSRRRRGRAGSRAHRGGRGPARAADGRGAGPRDRRPGRVDAPPGVVGAPGPGPGHGGSGGPGAGCPDRRDRGCGSANRFIAAVV